MVRGSAHASPDGNGNNSPTSPRPSDSVACPRYLRRTSRSQHLVVERRDANGAPPDGGATRDEEEVGGELAAGIQNHTLILILPVWADENRGSTAEWALRCHWAGETSNQTVNHVFCH